MLPKDITDILDNYDPEDLNIQITKVDYEANEPTFDIELSATGYNDEENITSHWTIQTIRYRKCDISLYFGTTLQINTTHPILWQFSDVQSSLYFSGTCSDADKLFMDLFNLHHSVTENLIPFEKTLHRIYQFRESMKVTSGLLADGPKKLLTHYASLLEKYNLQFTIIGDRTPTFWNGEKHIQESGTAKILFIDNSYVIADEFKFIAR